jgi:hypothetical protein
MPTLEMQSIAIIFEINPAEELLAHGVVQCMQPTSHFNPTICMCKLPLVVQQRITHDL